MHALTDHPKSLLDSFLNGTTDGHDLPYRLHTGADLTRHSGKLAEVPSGDLADDVIECRLKEGRSGLRDTILQLMESVSHTELGSHKGERIACGLRGECRGAAQASINLDDAIVLTLGVQGILNITLTHYAYMADDSDGDVAELLKLRVGQRL